MRYHLGDDPQDAHVSINKRSNPSTFHPDYVGAFPPTDEARVRNKTTARMRK